MKIGRPLAYDPEQALDSAMHIFWRKGYEATSLQDLLQGMKLSKSSLYQGFKNKHHLFLLCVNRYRQLTLAEMEDRLRRSVKGVDFFSKTFDKVIHEVNEVANPKGCLVTNTAVEFAQSDPDVATAVSDGVHDFQTIFHQAVLKGQQDGSIRTDIPSETLADYLVTSMNGLRTMVKAGTDEATLKNVVQLVVNTVR